MNTKEKQELVRLLSLYMSDMAALNEENLSRRQNGRFDVHEGVKARYEHARVLATRLSLEVSRELKKTWEL